ncbi:MAG: hypothetical protein LBT62_07025, partial [Deltaproteobacteria bacterium]|nr:hypothetical protein [Deltaproteobacteria bacterium]
MNSSSLEKGDALSRISSPRYRGLYLALAQVTLPAAWPGSIYLGSESDLDSIYPEELSEALVDRENLLDALSRLPSKGKRTLSQEVVKQRAMFDNELARLDRRLLIHNRRVRGAHLSLAERLGGGWPDYLRSLLAVVHNLEVQARDLGSFLNEIPEAAGPAIDELNSELETRLNSIKTCAETLKNRDASLDVEISTFSQKLGKRRLKEVASETLNILADLRTHALAALLEAEASVLQWRSLEKAPIEAPKLTDVPLPPTPRVSAVVKSVVIKTPNPRFSVLRILLAVSLGLVAALAVYSLFGTKADKKFIHIYNGLANSVTVTVTVNSSTKDSSTIDSSTIDSSTKDSSTTDSSSTDSSAIDSSDYVVLSSESKKIEFPSGSFTISSKTPQSQIETIAQFPDFTADQSLVYNIAGAAPLVEWDAYYEPRENTRQTNEKLLGAPILVVTDADFVLVPPPATIKTAADERVKLVLSALSGVHPDRMLAVLPQDSASLISASLIKAQARYNSPQATWTPLWLALLVQRGLDDAGTILKERLKDFPDDIQTNELIYRVSSPTEKARFCLQMNSLPAEKNGDLDWLYLKSLCLEG